MGIAHDTDKLIKRTVYSRRLKCDVDMLKFKERKEGKMKKML